MKKAVNVTVKLSLPALSEAFVNLENVVNEDAKQLEIIDNDIKAVQNSLKSLKFDAASLETTEIDLSDSEILSYDFAKKTIYYINAEKQGATPLLNSEPKVRKQVHQFFLSDLLTQIASDYKEAKQVA